jgi:hypothetical protein
VKALRSDGIAVQIAPAVDAADSQDELLSAAFGPRLMLRVNLLQVFPEVSVPAEGAGHDTKVA